MSEGLKDSNELLKERFRKYKAVKALSVNLFGGRFQKEVLIAERVAKFKRVS